MFQLDALNCFYASPCSRFVNVHLFLGTAFFLLGRHGLYLGVLWLVSFIGVNFLIGSGTSLFNSFYHAMLGLLFGIVLQVILSPRQLFLPEKTLRHHRSILVLNCQYLVAAPAFIPANLTVEENGFPYGVFLALMFFWIWTLFIYFVNAGKTARGEPGQDSEFSRFTRSILCLGIGISLVLLVTAIPFLNDYASSGVGVVVASIVVWILFKEK